MSRRPCRRAVSGPTLGLLLLLAGLPAGAAESDSLSVRRTIDAFFAAAQARDWDRAGDTMAEDFRIYVDGGENFDKKTYVELLKSDDMDVLSLRINDLRIEAPPASDMAFARYSVDVEARSHDLTSKVKTLETLVFTRSGEGDPWRIVHAHVSFVTPDAAGQ